MFLEWAFVVVCLVFSFVVDILEQIKAWFAFLDFKLSRISFVISLAVPCYVSMVFELVRTTTFLAFGTMCIACESGIFSFLTILTLEDTRVHVGTMNSSNVMAYIAASVNLAFVLFCES